VRDLSVADYGSRNSDGALGVIGGLTDSPFVFRISDIARDDFARSPFKAAHAVRIPPGDVLEREHLRLLTDGVSRGDASEAPQNAISDGVSHSEARMSREPPMSFKSGLA
jgi:hypothetical protein